MVGEPIFSKTERRVVGALGQLGFANPFGSKRWTLESSVFGVDARSVGPLGGREVMRGKPWIECGRLSTVPESA